MSELRAEHIDINTFTEDWLRKCLRIIRTLFGAQSFQWIWMSIMWTVILLIIATVISLFSATRFTVLLALAALFGALIRDVI